MVGAAIFNEAESHFGTPAKIAIDFLRNSRIGAAGNGLQYEAQRLGPPLKVGEDAATVLLLIVVCAGILVAHAVAEGVIEQNRNLAGGRRHCLRLART